MLSGFLEGSPDRLADLEKVPALINQAIQSVDKVIEHTERYRYMEHCAVLGRGLNYATAFEVALKVKELTRIVAEPYSSADFRHGPIATVSPGFPVILVAPSGAISADLSDLFQQLDALHAEQLIISDDPGLLSRSHLPLALPAGIPEWLTPLVAVIPGQLFALRLAVARDLNPDQPVGLKKVTETL
jgi:glutamine---fructose-6-phosphate transaminase (isomerizing)